MVLNIDCQTIKINVFDDDDDYIFFINSLHASH